jgi:hypothetical protein
VLGVAVGENVSPPDPAPPGAIPFIYNWLKQQPPSVVVEWPLPSASNLGNTHEPIYLYYSTAHWQRLVNGYSGFYPQSYIEFLDTMRTFPSRESIALLRARSVSFLIVHKEFDPDGDARLRQALLAFPEFQPIAAEGAPDKRVTVYRLIGPPAAGACVRPCYSRDLTARGIPTRD